MAEGKRSECGAETHLDICAGLEDGIFADHGARCGCECNVEKKGEPGEVKSKGREWKMERRMARGKRHRIQ